MAVQSKTELVISAVDKATATLNLIGAKLEGLVKPAHDVHKALGKLYDATGLGAVKSAVGSLSNSLVGLAKTTLGVGGAYIGATGTIVSLGISAAEAADNVGDLAEKYQVAANSLQVYGALVEEDGGTMEDAAAAIGKLKKAMNEAMHGGKEQAEAFRGVGISIADLKHMKAEEVMERMAGAFKGSDKDLAKQAVLLQLMGKNGQVMMGTFNRGADGIRDKFAEMRTDGRLFSDEQLAQADKFDKVWKRLHGTFDGLKNVLGLKLANGLMPLLNSAQNWMNTNRDKMNEGMDKFVQRVPAIVEIGIQLFQGLWGAAQIVGKAFKTVNGVLGPTGTTMLMLGGLMSPVILASAKLAWALGGVGLKLAVLISKIPGVSTALSAVWRVMLANPIGLLIAAVVGLGLIIYKNWDGIVAYVSGAWERIKAVFSVNFFDGVIQVWMEAWQALGNGILGIIKTILPDVLMPEAMRNFKFSFASEHAANMTAAQAAAGKTEVGGTLKIQIDGAPAKVTELSKKGQAMDIDVSSGLYMAGA